MKSYYKKAILVLYNYSDASFKATEFSAMLCNKMNRKLIILNIQDTNTVSYFQKNNMSLANDLEINLKKFSEEIADKHVLR